MIQVPKDMANLMPIQPTWALSWSGFALSLQLSLADFHVPGFCNFWDLPLQLQFHSHALCIIHSEAAYSDSDPAICYLIAWIPGRSFEISVEASHNSYILHACKTSTTWLSSQNKIFETDLDFTPSILKLVETVHS